MEDSPMAWPCSYDGCSNRCTWQIVKPDGAVQRRNTCCDKHLHRALAGFVQPGESCELLVERSE